MGSTQHGTRQTGTVGPSSVPAHDDLVRRIEEDGFVRIPGVLTRDRTARARELVAHWWEQVRSGPRNDVPRLVQDDPFVWNLQNKDFFFLELLFASDAVNGLLRHFLNDRWFKQIPPEEPNYVLRSYLARSSLDRLPMHIDSFVPYVGDEPFVMQAAFLLQDQDERNGCTRVVPGSHLSGEYAPQSAFDDAMPLLGEEGDVMIWDSRIWHGAGENRSGKPRWSIIATFSRWWVKQMFRITERLPEEFYARLTPAQKAVLGFCSVPNPTEADGIDMKRGFDQLRPTVADYA